MLRLLYQTPATWTEVILADLDHFLQDHAANERKACGSALRLATHHPECNELVEAMIGLAQEELEHFRMVFEVLRRRGQDIGLDSPDPYMSRLHRIMRKSLADQYLLDRLIVFAVVEARGCERFAMLAAELPAGDLKDIYVDLTRAEARHHALFLRLAAVYYPPDLVDSRLAAVLEAEAEIVRTLPLRAVLH